MTAFWHWYVVILTVGTIAATVWFLVWTARLRVDAHEESDGTETTGHIWDEDLKELNNPLPRWWLGLFWATVIFSLGYLVLYPGLGAFEGTLGWSQRGQYEREMRAAQESFEARYAELAARDLGDLADDPEARAIGRNLYANNCATCHGADAGGAPGYPALTDDHWLWGGAPEQVLTSILEGRNGVMPGFGQNLDEREITRTAVYVQQLAGRDVDSTMAAAGERHYRQLCVACHGPEGKGNPAMGAPDLTVGIYTHGGGFDGLRRTIRDGREGMMPAQRGIIGEVRSRLVAAYVLGLGGEGDDGE